MASLDYGVLNALNLINKNLGDAYQARGFNPFAQNFVLDKQFAQKLLAMKEEKRNVPVPEFLEQGQEEILRRLKNAKKRLLSIIISLEKACQNQVNFEILDAISFAQIAEELLKNVDLKNLSFEELLDLYQTISVLEPEFGKILTKIFDKRFSVQLAVQAFIDLCQTDQMVANQFRMDQAPQAPRKTQKKPLQKSTQSQKEHHQEVDLTF